MKNILYLLVFVSVLVSCNEIPPTIKGPDNEVINFRAIPFSIEDVHLLDGPFLRATKLNEQILMNYNPDRLLAKFRIEAGLQPKAEHYGGWEGETIAGHSLGHYLTAICLMYQTTGNDSLLKRAQYIVDELAECQKADGDGYIGAFPNGKKILEEEVAKGDIRSKGFDLNGIWVPFYTQHKVMDGLYHAYQLCGIKKALDVSAHFADWLYSVVKGLNENQVQAMLDCEHGGMNEALAELYQVTQNEKYLKMSYIFHHKEIIDSLSHGVDILPGKHANTQIPKFVGTARRYELTGSEEDKNASLNFWDRVVNHHSYVTGGNGNHEYFGAPDTLRDRLSSGTTETCNVYNMLKLSQHLFSWSANPHVLDFYERALLNQILSSQNVNDGHVVYNLSLDMGGYKEFQDPEWFTCCIGTGMENHSKYAGSIYFYNNEELFVGQFIASELNWRDKGVKVTQQTFFPEDQNTKLTLECIKPVEFGLILRYPYWANNGMKIYLNNEEYSFESEPGEFVTIHRRWNNGDEVRIEFPFSLRLETMPDDSNRVAVMYGPLVMAGILGPIDDEAIKDPMYVPVLKTEDRDPSAWLKTVDGQLYTFISNKVGYPLDVEFRPFFTVNDKRYSVYFDLFSVEKWEAFKADYEANVKEQKGLDAITLDFLQFGEMQPERDHNFKSERSWVGEYKLKKYREVDLPGFMEFEMKAKTNESLSVICECWSGFPGARAFEVYVNDILIGSDTISIRNTTGFYNSEFFIPQNGLSNSGMIKLKIMSSKGYRGGPIFSCRLVKGKKK
ncbi:MAG: glycoside hydrolase family 127 protein [Marinilabiliaceae bacterium]|nr:glycoside hydrolase family 127 protein [Marinilabiliaceae bacterium]